ncbi:MAG TPA: copper resistance CopC family protein [Ureibacillus sp.]|nr:copper resistance CopC family protein [Ureibacillus sp.]
MLKKFLLFSFIFIFSYANYAFAHTHIASSSPQNSEVLKEELKDITLTFEGKIEQSSSFTLHNAGGETISVDNITVADNVLTGTLSRPLENGEYLINWSIIGADGHVIEGEVPFTVDVAETETQENTKLETEDTEGTDAEIIMDTEKDSESAQQVSPVDNSNEENSSPSYLVPSLIGVLILIVVGSFLFIAKRKSRS